MKKFLFALMLIATFTCLFALSVSAETPNMYIEFKARFPGSDEYVTVYTQNAESSGNPRINFNEYKFYKDIDFTEEVDITTVTGLDFSSSVAYGSERKVVNRITRPNTPFTACTEVKWFTTKELGGDNVPNAIPTSLFSGWTALASFDFGCATILGDNAFQNAGLIDLVIPSTIEQIMNSTFRGCANLKSVVFESDVAKIGNGVFLECGALTTVDASCVSKTTKNMFEKCTSLVSIRLGNVSEISESMFSGCSALTTVDLSNATNMTSIGKWAFSNCGSLTTVISSGVNQVGAVIIPEGVTHINQEAFCNCDSIKYLSLPSTVTYLGPSVIRDSSGLEFVDFNDNLNDISLDNWGHFSGCSSLKAVSLPDNVTTISNRFMTYCSALKAVYLPANLVQMNTNGNGQGPFCFSGQMYFVERAFEVRGEDGYFFGDDFVMPAKPEVYYMPTNLSKADGNVSSGTWFRDCAGLNNTIVFSENFTDSTVVQMFRGTASATQRKNVVYLGKITNYAWSEMNKYIDFVFAHPENTDLSTLTFTLFYNRNNENCYFYFCSTGKKYTMAKNSVEEVATTLEENSYHHVEDPKRTNTVPADCVNNESRNTYCFCGEKISSVETENSALGHSHTEYMGYVYENYMAEGYIGYKCERCDDVNKDQKAEALFTSLGISAKTFGDDIGLVQGYTINRTAIAAYKNESEGFDFGILAYANKEGTACQPKPGDDKVVDIVFDNMANDYIDVKLAGIPEDYMDTALILCIYVKDKGGFYYLNNGTTAETIIGNSYNGSLK